MQRKVELKKVLLILLAVVGLMIVGGGYFFIKAISSAMELTEEGMEFGKEPT